MVTICRESGILAARQRMPVRPSSNGFPWQKHHTHVAAFLCSVRPLTERRGHRKVNVYLSRRHYFPLRTQLRMFAVLM